MVLLELLMHFKAAKKHVFVKKRAELHETEDVTTRNSGGPSGCKIRFQNTYDGSMNCKNAQEHGKGTETQCPHLKGDYNPYFCGKRENLQP